MMMKLTRSLVLIAAASVVLGACHFSNGSNGPVTGENNQAGAAPVVVPGSNSGKAKYGGTYHGGANVNLLQPAPAGTHPSIDGGAGFSVPNYPPTTLPGWIQGLPSKPALISWRHSPYGDILTTNAGKTIYVRLGDQYRLSGCSGICARAFPPVLTNGAPQATAGILPAYLGVLTATGHGEQVAYGQHPLYTYSGDTGPGQYNAVGKGGIWFPIGVDGVVIQPSSTTTTTPNG